MTLAKRIDDALARWNAGDLDGYLDLYAKNILLHGYTPQPMDLAAVRGFYGMIWATLSSPGRKSPQMQIGAMFETGQMLAFRGAMTGHHTGPFLGYPPTGKPYAIGVVTTMRFEGGKVAERWSCADMLGLLLQSGSIALPG